MSDLAKKFFSLKDDEQAQFYLKHRTSLTAKVLKEYLRSLDRKQYYYLVTFTLREECKDCEDEAELYIEKQFTNRPALKIEEAYISKERTKKDIAHWHVAVRSSKSIAKNRYNYYTKKFGFVDISKNKCQNLQDSLNYISKDVLPRQLV